MGFYVNDFVLIDAVTPNPLNKYLISNRAVLKHSETHTQAHSKQNIKLNPADMLRPSNSFSELQEIVSETPHYEYPTPGDHSPHDQQHQEELVEESHSQLSVIVQMKPSGDLVVRITAAPVDVFWNEQCMQKILTFLLSSQDIESLLRDPQLLTSVNRFAATAALPQSTLELIIEVDAPKIIVPENPSYDHGGDKGGLLLDTGVLCVMGHLGQAGISMNISLNSIHLG